MVKFIKKNVLYLLSSIAVIVIGFVIIYIAFSYKNSRWENLYLALGTTILVSGVVAIIDMFRQYFKDSIFSQVKNVLIDSRLQHIHKKRNIDKYDNLMNSVKYNIDITGYSLNSFYESYSEILKQNVSRANPIKIRILVVDPNSVFSKNRQEVEGHLSSSTIFHDIIMRMANELKKIPNIEIKIIATPLTTMIFRIDDIMFIGPHLYKKASKATLTYEINRGGWLFDVYNSEFEELWRNATKINDDNPT